MGDSTTLHLHPSNVEQARAWDGDEGDYWAAHPVRFDEAVVGRHQDEAHALVGVDDRPALDDQIERAAVRHRSRRATSSGAR